MRSDGDGWLVFPWVRMKGLGGRRRFEERIMDSAPTLCDKNSVVMKVKKKGSVLRVGAESDPLSWVCCSGL